MSTRSSCDAGFIWAMAAEPTQRHKTARRCWRCARPSSPSARRSEHRRAIDRHRLHEQSEQTVIDRMADVHRAPGIEHPQRDDDLALAYADEFCVQCDLERHRIVAPRRQLQHVTGAGIGCEGKAVRAWRQEWYHGKLHDERAMPLV